MVHHPSAALLIRVWLEDTGEFRARLLAVRHGAAELSAEETTVAVAASPGEALDVVRVWLEESTRRAANAAGHDG